MRFFSSSFRSGLLLNLPYWPEAQTMRKLIFDFFGVQLTPNTLLLFACLSLRSSESSHNQIGCDVRQSRSSAIFFFVCVAHCFFSALSISFFVSFVYSVSFYVDSVFSDTNSFWVCARQCSGCVTHNRLSWMMIVNYSMLLMLPNIPFVSLFSRNGEKAIKEFECACYFRCQAIGLSIWLYYYSFLFVLAPFGRFFFLMHLSVVNESVWVVWALCLSLFAMMKCLLNGCYSIDGQLFFVRTHTYPLQSLKFNRGLWFRENWSWRTATTTTARAIVNIQMMSVVW